MFKIKKCKLKHSKKSCSEIVLTRNLECVQITINWNKVLKNDTFVSSRKFGNI